MRLEHFLMADRVAALSAEAISVEGAVPEASPVFEGHFPGHPLLPGVMLIEAMAQAGGWLLLARNGFSAMPLLMRVKEAGFRRFVGPGAALRIECRLTHDGSGYAATEARVSHEGRRVAEAEILLRTMPFPEPGLREAMIERARAIGLPALAAGAA